MSRFFTVLLLAALALPAAAQVQHPPYFVTYSSEMEEPGNLEINQENTIGLQKHGLPTYYAPFVELEYGATGWWTTSMYVEGATQSHDATVFTGFRFENRFKPLKRDHIINPVLYFEFENINEASRTKKDIVGHAEPTEESLSELRGTKARELEAKLILSSNAKGWNFSENFIVEKNLTEDEGYEFGYALGVYRPLGTLASGRNCRLCRENFTAGLELYGGLGSTEAFGLANTAQYLAPSIGWQFAKDSLLRFSPGFGLTSNSDRAIFRVAYTYEIGGFGPAVARMFKGK